MAGKNSELEQDELIRTGSRRKKASGKRVRGRKAPDDPDARKRSDRRIFLLRWMTRRLPSTAII